MLEESVSNHGHERVAVEALPGSPLEVVETQFFFQLLVMQGTDINQPIIPAESVENEPISDIQPDRRGEPNRADIGSCACTIWSW